MQTLSSNTLTVIINAQGAELCSVKNKSGTEFVWQASPAVWPRHAPVLFPIVGKLKNNTYDFKNNTYELGQHGFARDKAFTPVQATASSCSFELRADTESKNKYPFDFLLNTTYALDGNRLSIGHTVENTGPQTLYFSIGAHPGFNCPLQAGESFEDYYLEFENTSYALTVLQNGLRLPEKKTLQLENKKLQLRPGLFDNDALVFEGSQINQITLCSGQTGRRVQLDCQDWPCFGIWAKKDCRKFVCLEPWYGIADSVMSSGNLIEKDEILSLAPGARFSCAYHLSFF